VRARLLSEAILISTPSRIEALAPRLIELAVPQTQQRRHWWHWRPNSDELAREARDLCLAEVARAWSSLPEDVRGAALACGSGGRWPQIVRHLASDTRGRVVAGLADIATRAKDISLFPVVLAALRHEDRSVSESGERALLVLCELSNPAETPDGPARDRIAAMIAEALEQPTPGARRAVSLAAVTLLDGPFPPPALAPTQPTTPDARLARLLREPGPAQDALVSSLRFTRSPLARLRALQWLAWSDAPRVRHAACARLSSAWSAMDHEAVLSHWHLTLRPSRKAALRGVIMRGMPRAATSARGARTTTAPEGAAPARAAVIPPNSAAPTPASLATLPDVARQGLARWTASISATSPVREACLTPLLTDEDDLVRASLVREGPGALLADLCFDARPAIARMALARQSADERERDAPATWTVDPSLSKRLGALTRSSDERVAHLATSELRALPDPLAHTPHGRLALLRHLGRDRDGALRALAQAIREGEAQDATRALLAARACGLAPLLASAIATRAARTGMDAANLRCVATCVACLAECADPSSRGVLLASLRHADPRVRANAVEALSRRGEPAMVAEVKALGDAHHRVRANLVRAVLRVATTRTTSTSAAPLDPAEELARMLGDDRPMHRLAGVWLARRSMMVDRSALSARWAELSARVHEVAGLDREPQVRARAASCAALLDARVRGGWRGWSEDAR
jgi:hypothetical protein